MTYSQRECKKALRDAKETIGSSPTIQEYEKLDISPSADTIIRKFDSWNKAKDAAELEKNRERSETVSKPEDLEIPDGKNWEDMSPYQRYYYRNRESEKKRTKNRRRKLKKWFKEYKKRLKCAECGESHPACLDFHHKEDKRAGVTELVSRQNSSKERIKKEIEKCKVLCANCHRKKHSDYET